MPLVILLFQLVICPPNTTVYRPAASFWLSIFNMSGALPCPTESILPSGKRVKRCDLDLGEFLQRLHYLGSPRILVHLVYYLVLAAPAEESELVDSLEVFAGCKAYSKLVGFCNLVVVRTSVSHPLCTSDETTY
jgi:hypothetical protein